uniref:Uncharacterized protein n=1 Tax=Rhodnius prolixus TaxID=13249 RepID=T1I5L5_RHOPR
MLDDITRAARLLQLCSLLLFTNVNTQLLINVKNQVKSSFIASFEFENEEYSILFNSYKFGDFPHTETNYGVIAKLLQNLGKHSVED